MKKLGLFLILIIISIKNVNAASNPYNQKRLYGTNCTWYAWKMAYEKGGVALPGLGDAKKWYSNAENKGYSVGAVPKANSIIVWGDWTEYGHVGYVEKFDGNKLYVWDSASYCIDEEDAKYKECMANSVCEETDRVCKQNAQQVSCEYNLSESYYSVTGYIYLDVAPQKSNVSSNTNTTIKKEENVVKEETKSNNANLSNIEISNGLIEFNKEIYEYNLEIENEIDNIDINASLEDNKAILVGNGNYKLNVGINKITLKVTAEDNSIKEYVINITRKEKIELEENIVENDKKLDEKEKDSHLTTIITSCLGLIVVIIISLLCIFKKKKSNNIKNKM